MTVMNKNNIIIYYVAVGKLPRSKAEIRVAEVTTAFRKSLDDQGFNDQAFIVVQTETSTSIEILPIASPFAALAGQC